MAEANHGRSQSCCKSPFGYWPSTRPLRFHSPIPRHPSIPHIPSPISFPETVTSARQPLVKYTVNSSRRPRKLSNVGESREKGGLEVVLMEDVSKYSQRGVSPEGFMVHRYAMPRRLIPIKKDRKPLNLEPEQSFEFDDIDTENGLKGVNKGRMGGWMLTHVKSRKPPVFRSISRQRVSTKRTNAGINRNEELYLKYLRLKRNRSDDCS